MSHFFRSKLLHPKIKVIFAGFIFAFCSCISLASVMSRSFVVDVSESWIFYVRVMLASKVIIRSVDMLPDYYRQHHEPLSRI